MHKYILDEFQADAYRQLRGDLSRQQMAAIDHITIDRAEVRR